MNSTYLNLNIHFLYLFTVWCKLLAILVAVCVLIAIDWRIPSNDKTSKCIN